MEGAHGRARRSARERSSTRRSGGKFCRLMNTDPLNCHFSQSARQLTWINAWWWANYKSVTQISFWALIGEKICIIILFFANGDAFLFSLRSLLMITNLWLHAFECMRSNTIYYKFGHIFALKYFLSYLASTPCYPRYSVSHMLSLSFEIILFIKIMT